MNKQHSNKGIGFWSGVGFAFVASLLGTVVFTFINLSAGEALAWRCTIGLLTLVYVLFLLWRSPSRSGKVLSVASVGVFTLAVWLLPISMGVFLLAHAGFITLMRSLHYYRGVFPAILDGGLSLLAVMALLWAFYTSGSTLMGIWTYFLVHSLFVLIPRSMKQLSRDAQSARDAFDDTQGAPWQRFEQAYANAQTALGQLAAHAQQSSSWRG